LNGELACRTRRWDRSGRSGFRCCDVLAGPICRNEFPAETLANLERQTNLRSRVLANDRRPTTNGQRRLRHAFRLHHSEAHCTPAQAGGWSQATGPRAGIARRGAPRSRQAAEEACGIRRIGAAQFRPLRVAATSARQERCRRAPHHASRRLRFCHPRRDFDQPATQSETRGRYFHSAAHDWQCHARRPSAGGGRRGSSRWPGRGTHPAAGGAGALDGCRNFPLCQPRQLRYAHGQQDYPADCDSGGDGASRVFCALCGSDL
jgi:hypothetical protein